jgi:hypothetical protein
MSQRPSLAKLAHKPRSAESAPVSFAAPAAVQEIDEQPIPPTTAPKVQRSRQGKRALTVYLAPELVRALRLFSVKSERSLEDLSREAFNELLRTYGEHPAA